MVSSRIIRITSALAFAIFVTTGIASAGDVAKPAAAAGANKVQGAATSAEKMAGMKAAMMKCSVCKHMAARMDELGPVMKMEVVKLNDGIAMMHSVTDPAKVATFHAAGKEMHTAGEACMTMTDEQAKTQLCEFCQEIRTLVKSGATMSVGNTKMGDIMVFTSSDPVAQAKITALGEKCALMAEAEI